MTTTFEDDDHPLCGDITCESAACRQSAIDAYNRRQAEDAYLFLMTQSIRSGLSQPEQVLTAQQWDAAT